MRPGILIYLLFAVPLPLHAESPAPRWDNSAVADAGQATFDYQVSPYFPDKPELNFPTAVHAQPYIHDGNPRLLISAVDGQLYDGYSNSARGAPKPAARLQDLVAPMLGVEPGSMGQRLWSTLFDRDFPQRPYLYVFGRVAAGKPHRNVVWRFKVTGPELHSATEPNTPIDPIALSEPLEIINWNTAGHDGGDMAWGPQDGMLYISAGDRSSPGDPNNVGQRVDEIHGSILRIDVHSKQPYAVPPDNPFVGMENVRPEIWSYGLRNPWRMAFHPERGELWVGDNGDESWELVHHIKRGANAGWSAFEGSQIFRARNKLAGPTLVYTPAAVQHPHSEMRSIIGGFFYRGKALPELRDHYIYGCYFTKRLWAFSYKDGKIGTPFQIADTRGAVVAITEDSDREPLITNHDGKLYRLAAKSAPPASRPWPAKLSATGIFASTEVHRTAPGVYPYAINAESWSDGATKQRFVALAAGKRMRALGGIEIRKSWDLPPGSMLGQTLFLRGRKIETQLLYFDHGSWRGYTYQWHADGNDATLVPAAGRDTEVGASNEDGGKSQKWRFSSRAECMTCHTHRSNFALGLTTRQLDRPRPGAGGENQLDWMVAAGLLENNGTLKRQRDRPFPDPKLSVHDLETRARSYLHLNCAHCHRESGLGGRAAFQLLAHLSLQETGILNAKPLVGLTGSPDARILAPGNPENSELLTRLSRRGAGQMPLVGTHFVDNEGVALLTEWIQSASQSR